MHRTGRSTARLALLLAGVVLAVVAVVGLVAGGDDPPGDVPVVPTPASGSGEPLPDPFAWDPDRAGEFERRAAAGSAHVLYALSPGGAVASAARTARWRPQIDAAARTADVDPATLEGLVFLESAGRPDAVTPAGLDGAVGLTQIVAETGQNLLGMHVDLAASRRVARRLEQARRHGHDRVALRLEHKRARVDERFDPQKSLQATARYLTLARKRFGREDLAFVSYHMGIGNLENVLRDYAGPSDDPIGTVVADQGLSYVRVYFDSTPTAHAAAWRRLSSFGDDSSNYLWKILAAREIMRLWRDDRPRLEQLAALQTAKASAEEVLHPASQTERFATPDDLRAAWDRHDIVAFPDRPADTGLDRDPRMGELAHRVGAEPPLYHGLRPEALALAIYVGAQVRSISGESPLIVTSAVRDETYQRAIADRNPEATHNYSLHTTGWAFDVRRRYRSNEQARAFQFMLDRLEILNVIAWAREPSAIHITAGPDAKLLLPLLDRVGIQAP